MTSYKDENKENMGRVCKKLRRQARMVRQAHNDKWRACPEHVEENFEAQRSMRTFYEAVKGGYTDLSAAFRSSIISTGSSSPVDILINEGSMPALRHAASERCHET